MTTLPARFRRNALANYAGSFVTLALALLVTPILVRGLGKEAYGTWVLVTSLVLYFNLLKFGFSKAAIKYVAEGNAAGDLDRVRRTVATSFAALSLPGLALLLAAPVLAYLFPVLFDVSADLKLAAMILVVLSVVDLAVAIPADTFGSALSGFQRYELLNATLTATALAQAVAWTVILALGGGLVAISVAGVSLSITSQFARYVLVRVLCGGSPLRRRYVDRSLLKPLMSMSGWIALTDFAEVVIGGIDPIVVGLIAGVSASRCLRRRLEAGRAQRSLHESASEHVLSACVGALCIREARVDSGNDDRGYAYRSWGCYPTHRRALCARSAGYPLLGRPDIRPSGARHRLAWR